MLLRTRAEDILDMVDKTTDEFKALDEISGGDIRIGCAESDSAAGAGAYKPHVSDLEKTPGVYSRC